MGFEPTTFDVTGRHSNQLSYFLLNITKKFITDKRSINNYPINVRFCGHPTFPHHYLKENRFFKESIFLVEEILDALLLFQEI